MVELTVLGGFEEYTELDHGMVDVIVGSAGVAHHNPLATLGQFDAGA